MSKKVKKNKNIHELRKRVKIWLFKKDKKMKTAKEIRVDYTGCIDVCIRQDCDKCPEILAMEEYAQQQANNLNKAAVNVSLPCEFAEWILKSRFIRCRDIDNYWWEKENDPTNTPYQTGDLYILFRRGNER